MTKNKQSVVSNPSTLSARMEKFETAFNSGQLVNHAVVRATVEADATGQRGWGPMMQT